MEKSNRAPFSYQDELTPSIRWYGLSLLVLLGGFGFLYQYIMTGFDRINTSLIQMESPSVTEMVLSHKGEHGIFLETSTLYNDKAYLSTLDDADGLTVTVVRKEDDYLVPMIDVKGNAPYTLFGREGAALYSFQVEKTGAYIVTVGESPQGKEKPLIVAVSGLNPSYAMTNMLLDGSLIFLMIGAVTVALWAAVFIMRKRDKEKKHWSSRGSGNAGKSAATTESVVSKAESPDGEPDFDLRPNGKRKKRKK